MLRGVEEVARFARRMVHTLSKPHNVRKSGWRDCSLQELEAKLDEEYSELKSELRLLRDVQLIDAYDLAQSYVRIADEATDLACVAMMITDTVGGLDEARYT